MPTPTLPPLPERLRNAYYYTELGGWRGPEVGDDERWAAVAEVAAEAIAAQAAEIERLTAELSGVLDAVEDDMPLDRALRLAGLWSEGKLIGGDAHAVSISLLHEIERLTAALAEAVAKQWSLKPVSCWCATCDRAVNPFPSRMSLCPQCGDKRCPRAENHDAACSAPPTEPQPITTGYAQVDKPPAPGLQWEPDGKCWCHTCRPVGSGLIGDLSDIRMVLCPDCGNKRCPKAQHHDHHCTGSNATGQLGSAYGRELCAACVTPKVCTRDQRCVLEPITTKEPDAGALTGPAVLELVAAMGGNPQLVTEFVGRPQLTAAYLVSLLLTQGEQG